MTNLGAVLEQLRQERSRLDSAIEALSKVVKGGAGMTTRTKGRQRRRLSAAARERIAAAQRARWAKVRSSAKK